MSPKVAMYVQGTIFTYRQSCGDVSNTRAKFSSVGAIKQHEAHLYESTCLP